jgi:reactive intermediate/imine deaminase
MSNRIAQTGIILAVLLTLGSCAEAPHEEEKLVIRFLNSPEAEARGLPFSQAVRVGDLLFLSGQLGIKPGTSELVPGGIEAEANQALENMKAILERNGSSIDRVVKCTVFLADIDEWPKLNEVYSRYFLSTRPARSALAANGLAMGARVEIECIAVVDAAAQ